MNIPAESARMACTRCGREAAIDNFKTPEEAAASLVGSCMVKAPASDSALPPCQIEYRAGVIRAEALPPDRPSDEPDLL